MSTPSSYFQGGLPRVLVGAEGIPPRHGSLLWDAEVGAIDRHEAVVAHVVGTEPALKVDLWDGNKGRGKNGEVRRR